MHQVSRYRPSPAMVVAVIGLIVAMGGTTYAAVSLPRNSVGSKQLKKNAVTAKKVKKNAVTSAKVKNDSIVGTDVKESTLGKVPTAGAADSASISKLTYKSATFPVASGALGHGQVSCDPGQKVTGGGVKGALDPSGAAADHLVQGTYPVGTGAWAADVFNVGGAQGDATVYAICAPAVATG